MKSRLSNLYLFFFNKRYSKQKGQSGMKNPETLATLDTCETGQNQIKHKNTDN